MLQSSTFWCHSKSGHTTTKLVNDFDKAQAIMQQPHPGTQRHQPLVNQCRSISILKCGRFHLSMSVSVLLLFALHSSKPTLTIQKNGPEMKMYFLLKIGKFHCYVTLPKGIFLYQFANLSLRQAVDPRHSASFAMVPKITLDATSST